jgi:hypothetical protein
MDRRGEVCGWWLWRRRRRRRRRVVLVGIDKRVEKIFFSVSHGVKAREELCRWGHITLSKR